MVFHGSRWVFMVPWRKLKNIESKLKNWKKVEKFDFFSFLSDNSE